MLTLNTQSVEGRDAVEDGSLDIFKVFPTLQGEGPFAGRPAVFCRLAGCNLSKVCTGCDTDYTSARMRMRLPDLLLLIQTHASELHTDLVVLTGGEPFRQRVSPLIYQLLQQDAVVQVETNGTMFDDGLEPQWVDAGGLSVVCSPKTPALSKDILPFITAYKYILDGEHVSPDDGLPTSSLGGPHPPARPHKGFVGEVFVQPCDEQDPAKNEANLKAAVASCMKYGYRLSVQIHKSAGLE